MGQGPQDNESAVEQAKDEQISDFIRSKYKSTSGMFPPPPSLQGIPRTGTKQWDSQAATSQSRTRRPGLAEC